MPSDTRAALEWIEYQQSLCSGCGSPRSLTMDPEHEHDWEPVALTCFKCRTRDAETRRIQDDAAERGDIAKADLDGLLVAVVDREG